MSKQPPRKLSKERVSELMEQLRENPYGYHLQAIEAFRIMLRERAQLAARVEELEDQNRALKAALDGTLMADDGPEAA